MRRLGKILLIIMGIGVLFSLVFGILTFTYYYVQPLPPPNPPLASELYDDTNKMVSTLGSEKRFEVSLDDISLNFQRAVVAVEDHRFFNHRGVDIYSILRAFRTNLQQGGRGHGGSTITQQMATSAYDFLGKEDKTYTRKIREAIIAIKLETMYTKEEILEFYCNVIYLGHGVYGVESASQLYFGKSAAELTLNEAATITGLIKGPNFYSPYVSPEKAKERRDIALDRMAEVGFITQEQADATKQEEIVTIGLPTTGKNIDHFRYAVIKYITDELPLVNTLVDGKSLLQSGGLKIYTTMNTQMQEAAEASIERWDEDPNHEGLEIALAAVDPQTGEIKAMVGSRDLNQSSWNRVFAKRPPGSTFKPILYAAALETRAYTTASIFDSAPQTFDIYNQEPYEPKELHEDEYFGPISMRTAIAKSSNIAAIQLNYALSADPYKGPWSIQLIDLAQRLGIQSPLDPVLSLPLGVSPVTPLEMASAYACFTNGGYQVRPFFIKRIEDKYGNVLLDNRPYLQKVLDENVAYLVTDMLGSVFEPGGTASYLKKEVGRPAAAKTGTSEEKHDGWFVGFTPDLACAVWTGSDNNQTSVSSGGGTAGYAWSRFMREGLKGSPLREFARPNGIVSAEIDPESGLLATRRCPETVTELFLAGTEPTETCPLHPNTIFPPLTDTDGDGKNDWQFWDWLWGRQKPSTGE